MKIQHFFDERSSALTYVVYEESSRVGVVIDPVFDLELTTGGVSTGSADAVLRFVDRERLSIPYALDTHAHADHPSGITHFRRHCGSRAAVGRHIVEVQRDFRDLLALGPEFDATGAAFDELLEDGVPIAVGSLEVLPLHTPGHTPDCMSYLIEDTLFVGDTLFHPDAGTGRCDFPGGSPEVLFDSVYRIYRDLPDSTRVLAGHDYRSRGRSCGSSLWDQRRSNIELNAFTRRDDFVRMRLERDATFSKPWLTTPAIRFNLEGGRAH